MTGMRRDTFRYGDKVIVDDVDNRAGEVLSVGSFGVKVDYDELPMSEWVPFDRVRKLTPQEIRQHMFFESTLSDDDKLILKEAARIMRRLRKR